MLLRRLFTIAFALFFAALVPMALACDLSARGSGTCAGVRCDSSGRIVHCASERAAHAVALSKPGGDAGFHLPVAGLQPATVAPSAPRRVVSAVRVPPHRPIPPFTLVSLAVLLRI